MRTPMLTVESGLKSMQTLGDSVKPGVLKAKRRADCNNHKRMQQYTLEQSHLFEARTELDKD